MPRNDLMTALLDTRRALEEQVCAVGERVEASRREVTEAVTSQVSDLHADHRETRTRVNSASASISEINKSLPALRQDVADLSRAVQDLRTAMSDLFARLPEAVAEPSPASAGPVAQAPDPAAPASGVSTDGGSVEGSSTPVAAPADQSEAQPADELQGMVQRQAAADVIRNAHSDVQGASADGAPAPEADSASNTERGKHDVVLSTAATVGTVDLVCHRDLWDFIQERATEVSHFRVPAALTEEGRDRLRITLSGRSVIGVLIAMRATQVQNAEYGKDDGTWSLSGAVYRRLAQDLTTARRDGTVPLTVVFDDGINTVSDEQGSD